MTQASAVEGAGSGSNRESHAEAEVPAWVPRLAVALGALGLVAALVTAGLTFANRAAVHDLDQAAAVNIVLPIGFSLIGALLAGRRPRNPIGWMLLAMAVLMGLDGVTHEYVLRSAHFGRLPFVPWVAWTYDWTDWLVFPVGLATFFYLLFPDGRLQSRGWRWVAGFAGLMTAFGVVVFAMEPKIELTGVPAIRNPIGWRVLDPNGGLGLIWFAGIALIIVAMVGSFVRRRRATGEYRLQLRWLSFVTVLTAVALAAALFVPGNWVFPLVILFGYGIALPVTCAIAILKYRLYDIDRIIRRTVQYGLLTAILVAIYAGLVVGIGSALGQTNDPLLIAGATLLVAALVRPLRRRIQSFLERRFARRRYDAAGVLATFSARLRDEVNLDDVRGLLQGAVLDTVRPARVGIWLREPASRTDPQAITQA